MAPKKGKSLEADVSVRVKSEDKLRPVEDEITTKTLTELEVERLEKHRLLDEFRAKEIEALDLRLSQLQEKRTILELSIRNLEIERRNLLDAKTTVLKQREKDRLERVTHLEQIKARLNVKGNFGYNPDTLEIVQE